MMRCYSVYHCCWVNASLLIKWFAARGFIGRCDTALYWTLFSLYTCGQFIQSRHDTTHEQHKKISLQHRSAQIRHGRPVAGMEVRTANTEIVGLHQYQGHDVLPEANLKMLRTKLPSMIASNHSLSVHWTYSMISDLRKCAHLTDRLKYVLLPTCRHFWS